MRKSLIKLLGIIVALVLSTTVSAIGLGGINVVSALGQPLKADIELVSVNKNQKTSLVARLASPDIYKGAGLEYPYGNKFEFRIESHANGEPYLKVGSAQPINDPFVSLLVELTWSSGKLLREYTFLLDPPGYVAEQPAPAEVQAVAPAAAEEAVEQTAQERQYQQEWVESLKKQPQPVRAAASMDEKTPSAVPENKPATSVVKGDITVRRGDTLSKIAMQNKPADVSLERMLVALYRANAEQFDGKNMNRIRAGKILRLPDQSELIDVAQPDAAKEIRAHVADWNVYRQKLAGAAAIASQSREAQQVATGKIASSVADKAPVAKETAKEVLKLSKGEAPGDQAVAGTAGKSVSAEDKKNAAQEDAIAKAKASKEEQTRVALLEKNLEDMQRLATLKSEAAALAQSVSGAASTVPTVAAASEVKPAPVAKPKPQPQPVVEPALSLVDEILGEPLYLIGGAAILLGLGGLGFMLSRRRSTPVAVIEKQPEAIGVATGRMSTPVAPSPDTGDFTSAAATRAETAPPTEDVDPISEADLFLNFGRDAQAEEILKEALRNTPNNHQIHLKLLGIYANRKDANSFSAIARQLQDSGDAEAWQQAAAMGRKLEPNNPMYGGSGTIEDANSATMQTTALGAAPGLVAGKKPAVEDAPSPEVDFDLGMPTEKFAALPEQEFLDDTEKTTNLTSADQDATTAAAMDFDVTSTNPSLVAPVGMDFDITSTHPPMPAAQFEPSQPAEAARANEVMEFTLDLPVEDIIKKPAPEPQPTEIGLADINLNLDNVAEPNKSEQPMGEQWHEVATKLDLAKAYQEMGDMTGAREILEEVLREGDEGQREAAQTLLDQLG
ncbi:MAG TPA: FimV/HubP family polar landmark protein [Gallionella sp.]|nr:FimV/HubP family polar landmark protein [Gallionella sp.]